MSEESIQLLKRFHGAFNRRDVDGAIACVHPAAEFRPALPGPDHPGPFLGSDGAREYFETNNDVWQALTVDIKEATDAPDNQIIAVEDWRGRGRDGIEIEVEITDLYAFRDGLIIRVDGFRDRADALQAAGLSE